jgi:hypothetical protein
MKRKSVLLIVVALFLFSCEPTDWHYILDDPSDLDNVVFVDNSPVDITNRQLYYSLSGDKCR